MMKAKLATEYYNSSGHSQFPEFIQRGALLKVEGHSGVFLIASRNHGSGCTGATFYVVNISCGHTWSNTIEKPRWDSPLTQDDLTTLFQRGVDKLHVLPSDALSNLSDYEGFPPK